MAAYPFKEIEAKWQAHWEGQATFRVPEKLDTSKTEVLRARHVSLPVGRRAPRRPSRRATRRPTSSRATSACAASTCCTRWAGTRSACRPSSTRSRPARTRASRRSATSSASAAAEGARLLVRLGARDRHDRSRLLQVDAVDLPAAVRARPRLRGGGAGLTGAPRSARAGERRGHRRQVARAAASRRAAADAPVDAEDHRVRRAAARGSRRPRLAEQHEADAARLDRPQRGRRGRLRASRGTNGRDRCACSRRGPTRCSARRTWCSRPSTRSSRSSRRRSSAPRSTPIATRRRARASSSARSCTKDKTGVFTGAYAVNPVNGKRDPDLDRRLRAHELRHRRDHGRAGHDERDFEFAREVRPAGHPRSCSRRGDVDDQSACARRRRRDQHRGFLDGLTVEQAKAAMIDVARGDGQRPRPRQLQAARLAVLAPALLGRAVPDRARRTASRQAVADRRAARRCCPSSTTSSRRGSAERPLATARRRGSRRPIPTTGKPRAPRDEHDAAVGRLVLVLPALHRSDERRRSSSIPSAGEVLDARRPLRRRRRARACCTCSTRASGTRCSRPGLVTRPSRSRSWSTRA